jgi:Domain of unknown function (DUF4375)
MRILMSQWFGFVLAVLMVACVGSSLHDSRPPTEIENAISYGSIAVTGAWFLVKSWHMWNSRGAKPPDTPDMRPIRFRFKLRSLMIMVAVVAGLLAVALSPIGLAITFGLLYLALIGVQWWSFRGFRRLSILCFAVLVAFVNIVSAALCIYLLNMGGAFLMFLGLRCGGGTVEGDPKIGERYWQLVEPVWKEISIYDGPSEFLRQFHRVRPEAGHLFAAHWCQSEVRNGGFHQFFSNSTGVLAPEALAAFRAIGLEEWALLLNEAMRFFGEPYPREQDERQELLATVPGNKPEEWDPFDALDGRFYDWLDTDGDRWERAADAYASRVNA